MSVTTERVEPRLITGSHRQNRCFQTVQEQQCLIISRDEGRTEMLSQMATDGGWDTTAVGDIAAAWRTFWGNSFALAIVDSESAGNLSSEVREFAEHLSSQPGTLLVVCGTPGQNEEELWARQSGAWMYLPGVRAETDLTSICFEAAEIARRLSRVPTSINRIT